MNAPANRKKPASQLDFEIHFAENLARLDVLDTLQSALRTTSPRFCQGLRAVAYEGDPRAIAIDVTADRSLHDAVIAKGAVRGATFARLAAADPPGPTRPFGHALLRGASRSASLIVSFDDDAPIRRAGDAWLFSNGVSGTARSARIGEVSALAWVSGLLEALAEQPAVVWGAAYDVSEFHARNLYKGSDGQWALGRDASRALPGLYWLNVFGPPYRELIGDGSLRGTQALETRTVGTCVLSRLYDDPSRWSTPENRAVHDAVVREIGPQYFFDREAPGAATVAPRY